MTEKQITEAWRVHEGEDYLTVYVTTFTNDPTVFTINHPSAEDRRRASIAAAAPAMKSIIERLIQWDKDFPVNCHNGYAGLQELNKIIADGAAIVAKAKGGAA